MVCEDVFGGFFLIKKMKEGKITRLPILNEPLVD